MPKRPPAEHPPAAGAGASRSSALLAPDVPGGRGVGPVAIERRARRRSPWAHEGRPVGDGTYVLVTRAATRVGTAVRRATRSEFNHASLALVQDGRCAIYSFARRLHCAPFYSGMVREGADRLRANVADEPGSLVLGQVLGLDDAAIRRRVEAMYHRAASLHYNTFDAVASVLGRGCAVRDSFTCVTFIPFALGLDLPYVHTIGDLMAALPLRSTYAGTAETFEPDTGLEIEPGEARYWTRWGTAKTAAMTLANFATLTSRWAGGGS